MNSAGPSAPSANTAASSAWSAARLSSSLWTGDDNADHDGLGPGFQREVSTGSRRTPEQRDQDRGGGQLGGHPDQPQHERRDHRAVRAQRGGQGRHQHPLAHAQAAGQDGHHEPGRRSPAPRWRSPRAPGRVEPGPSPPLGIESRRTTASWLRPSRTQPADDQSSPWTSSRPESRGSASGPTPGDRQADQPGQPAEHRRQDHDQERQAQPQARQRRQPVDAAARPAPRPGSVDGPPDPTRPPSRSPAAATSPPDAIITSVS